MRLSCDAGVRPNRTDDEEMECRRSGPRDTVRYSKRRGAQFHDWVDMGGREGLRKLTITVDEVEVAPGMTAARLRLFRSTLAGPPQGSPKRRRLRGWGALEP